MLLPRRVLSSFRRVYGRVLVSGVFVTLLLFLLYKVNRTSTISSQLDVAAAVGEPWSEGADSDTGGRRGVAQPLLRLHSGDKEYFESEIRKDLAMQRPGLGDNGEAVHLSGTEEARGEQDLAKIALNEELSKHLSYNRTSPDGRNPHCKRLRYDTSKLPSAAVIIIFFDEPYSVVLRTVHSVINTASENLKEVILVDDASTHEELKGKLDHYVATRLPKMVKLVRMKTR